MGASTGPIISASASPHPSPLLEPRDAQRTNENGQGQVGAFLWPQRFFTRQSISRNWENSPYITAILKNTNVPLTLEEPGEEDNIFFLRTEENWAADKYRVAPLIAFLRGATITELQHGDIKDVRGNGNTAIIIDGNISHGKGRFRPYLGSLSPLRLLEELRAKVSSLQHLEIFGACSLSTLWEPILTSCSATTKTLLLQTKMVSLMLNDVLCE